MPFKQAFRVAFISLIWKQYKALIISTILLFVFLYLVGSLHADFLAHAKLNADSSGVGASFIYKWLALISGVFAYFGYHYWRPKKSQKQQNKEKQKRLAQELDELADHDDPFHQIRQRKKLRSRADFIINKDKQ